MPPPSTPVRPRRQGPRPLPLHLATLSLSCNSSSAALALWNAGLLPWSPSLQPKANGLAAELSAADPKAFQDAVACAARQRLRRFVDGVMQYRQLEYRREVDDRPVLWAQDNARLLDYRSSAGGQPMLVVPSLVNRAFILDLSRERSILSWLADHGVAPMLLDWGTPGPVERRFSLTDYITGPLEAALVTATDQAGGPVILAGYCMGGLLALAAALRRPELVSKLVLLATPWDFQTDPSLTRRIQAMLPMLRAWISVAGELPVDLLQAMVFSLDPLLVLRKFDRLDALATRPERLAAFAALEDWLNDGVALAGPVAEECLVGWYSQNSPALRRWRVAGRVVDPTQMSCPSLVIVPSHDRIVTPASATALAKALPGAEIWTPPVGHIGMITSSAAPEQVWRPLAAWLGV